MKKNKQTPNYCLTQVVLPMYVDKLKTQFLRDILPNPDNLRRFLTFDLYQVTAHKLELVEAKPIYVALSHYTTDFGWEIVFAEWEETFVNENSDSIGMAFATKGNEVRVFNYEKGVATTGEETAFVCELKYDDNQNLHLNFGKTKTGVRMPLFAGKVVEILKKG